ncbi:MAG: M15 family metallopeptidase [Reichenbachiella sp.]
MVLRLQKKNTSYVKGGSVVVNKVCGDYLKIKGVDSDDIDGVEGHWVLASKLMTPLSEGELALVEGYKTVMSSDVADDYEGFVADFREGGYFTGNNEPLTWMEEQGLQENEITFLGMAVSKIITPFKEVLEETEKNLQNDYPAAYAEIVAQYTGAASLIGQAQIRYIANTCKCNPSNHSLGAAIDIRPALNPQITSDHKAYISLIKYLTGLDLTKSKTAQQVIDAQEIFMMKLHEQKIKQYSLKQIIDDYKLVKALMSEFDLLDKLKSQDIEINNFQEMKKDLIDVLNAHKNRVVFETGSKAAIDAMVTYLQGINSGNTIDENTITNWDQVVIERTAFLEMVKNAGFTGLDKFIEYFEVETGKPQKNSLLLNGFGETRLELVNSFHKAHQTISQKYSSTTENGEWGGSYSYKYDGMHFGLKTSFIKSLTNK